MRVLEGFKMAAIGEESPKLDGLKPILGSDARYTDFTKHASVLVHLFKYCTLPPISFSSRGKVNVPDSFIIRIGGSTRIFSVIDNPTIFADLDLKFQLSFLDILSILLSKGMINTIRLQCHDEEQDGRDRGSSKVTTSTTTANIEATSSGESKISSTQTEMKTKEVSQAQDMDNNTKRSSLVRSLLNLLEFMVNYTDKDKDNQVSNGLAVQRKIIYLIGLCASVGLTTTDLRDILGYLRSPSALTLPMLQAFKRMLGTDNIASKANPMSFFSFGGIGSGMTSNEFAFPFMKTEYSFFTWFRIEEFENHSATWDGAASTGGNSPGGVNIGLNTQHLISISSDSTHNGIDVFIKNKVLNISMHYDDTSSSTIHLADVKLSRGVWYHIAIKHQKASRMNMFAKDQLFVHIDHQAVFQEPIKYPTNMPLLDDLTYQVGYNFDGQIAPIYFYGEILTRLDVETLARIDAGKMTINSSGSIDSNDTTGDAGSENRNKSFVSGLLSSSNSSDTKSVLNKASTAYYPSRCIFNHAIDIYSGNHAKMGPKTSTWNIVHVRDLFDSIGGISSILPVLPRILIDNYDNNKDFMNSPSQSDNQAKTTHQEMLQQNSKQLQSGASDEESSLYEIMESSSLHNLLFESNYKDKGDTCIALILQIFAKMLNEHPAYQKEILSISGIEMIEYALSLAPDGVLRGEGDNCVLALKLLRHSIINIRPLEVLVTTKLLLNFSLWAKASFNMQKGMMRMILTTIKMEPVGFGSLIEVHDVFDAMVKCYAEVDETDNAEQNENEKVNVKVYKFEDNGLAPPLLPESDQSTNDQNNTTSTPIVNIPESDSEENDSYSHLGRNQKKLLRQCMQTIIVTAVRWNTNIQNHIQAIIDFMAVCTNVQILDETAQSLLLLIVNRGAKTVSAIIEACHGAEEFASFIIRYIVHQPNEKLRCTGIRIITHFYLRVDLTSNDLSKLTLQKAKGGGNIVSRAMERITDMGQGAGHGLHRLQTCGGLALLSEVITNHKSSSNILTYKVLLEMLLTRSSDSRLVNIQHINLFEKEKEQGQFNELEEETSMLVGEYSAQFMSPDRLEDDFESTINAVVLPLFLELLPKLNLGDSLAVVFGDLVNLLNYNEINREVISSVASWHTCMYDLLSRLMSDYKSKANKSFKPADFSTELEKWAEARTEDGEGSASPNRSQRGSRSSIHDINSNNAGGDIEIWFAVGRKVYSTLMQHVLGSTNGWLELSKTVSQSLNTNTPDGYLMYQSVLSQLVSELSFFMSRQYKEFQKLACSPNQKENTDVLDYLNNVFSVLVTIGQFALHDTRTMTFGIQDWKVAKLRLIYLKEVMIQRKKEMAEKGESEGVEDHLDNEYYFELAEMLLEKRVQEKREQETNGEGKGEGDEDEKQEITDTDRDSLMKDAIEENNGEERASVSGATYNNKSAKGALNHPYLEGVKDIMSFSTHRWLDLTDTITGAEDELNENRFKGSEFLHPIERGQDLEKGQLILVLQNLRFFDSFFWPDQKLRLRNSPMMRFHKEKEWTDEVPVDPEHDKKPPKFPRMTLCVSVISQCFYVMHRLNPLNELAETNVARLHAVIESIDNVPSFSTPRDDLVLASVTQITFSLQRIGHALEYIYDLLGITTEIEISNIGLVHLKEEEFEDERMDKEESRFNDIYEDESLKKHLENYFDTPPGYRLLCYIRTCMLTLVSAFDVRTKSLGKAMEERIFSYLESLVGRIRFDLSYHQKHHVPAASKSKERGGADAVPIPLEEYPDDIFDMGGNGAGMKAGSNSPDGKASARRQMPLRSVGHLLRDVHFPADGITKFTGPLIIKMLQWMRDSYFACNLNKNMKLVKSIAALEFHEAACNRGYMYAMGKLNASMYSNRDLAVDSIKEMSNLQNLSGYISKIMQKRYSVSSTSRETRDIQSLKLVSKKWKDSINVFSAEWSPWYVEKDDEEAEINRKGTRAMVCRHKDSSMRQMLIINTNNPIDHTEAAYQETKDRDALAYENSLKGVTTEEVEADKGDADLHSQRFASMIKDVQTFVSSEEGNNNKQGNANWSDDEDEMEAFTESLGVDGINPGLSAVEEKESSQPARQHLFSDGSDAVQRPFWTDHFHWQDGERPLCSLPASRITIDKVISGSLLLTTKCLYFHPEKLVGGLAMQGKTKQPPLISYHDRRWFLDYVREFYGRRYLLQNCAIELFFHDDKDVLFALDSFQDLQKFFRLLHRQQIPRLKSLNSLNPRYLVRNSPYTEMWKKRQISNFEYLMHLNVLSGRSYSDITQYPVFPWVISDYNSTILDLSGDTPGVFRDLSRPIGALDDARLKEIMDRYDSFDADTPQQFRFMYGSHYSSAGVVIYFNIRQEPFTSLAVNLQGGRFDCPDRLFFNMASCWKGVNESMSDVKELIPEMYCCPEMFQNSNRLPLGELQEGDVPVDDVILPPWANGSAYEFVRINREALESDYVSEHLHEWIDLIFGFKQQGEEAIKAQNLFYHLTYENAIDISAIKDDLQREAAKAQVTYFGQTPSQLFRTPHEKRLSREECLVPLGADLTQLSKIMAFTPLKQLGKEGGHGALLSVRCSQDKLVAVHADRTVCTYGWSTFPDGEGVPFEFRPLKTGSLPTSFSSLSAVELNNNQSRSRLGSSNSDTGAAGSTGSTDNGHSTGTGQSGSANGNGGSNGRSNSSSVEAPGVDGGGGEDSSGGSGKMRDRTFTLSRMSGIMSSMFASRGQGQNNNNNSANGVNSASAGGQTTSEEGAGEEVKTVVRTASTSSDKKSSKDKEEEKDEDKDKEGDNGNSEKTVVNAEDVHLTQTDPVAQGQGQGQGQQGSRSESSEDNPGNHIALAIGGTSPAKIFSCGYWGNTLKVREYGLCCMFRWLYLCPIVVMFHYN